jgi:protein TonB
MTSRLALHLALPGAFAALAAGCASAGGAASGSASAPSAACASAAMPPDPASQAAAFDSLHRLLVGGQVPGDLVLAPHDRKPQLDNAAEVQELLRTMYPKALRDAGVQGTAQVAALLDTRGVVRDVKLVRPSMYSDLDAATLAVVKRMRFTPAKQGNCPVPFFMSLPVTWSLERGR